MLDVRGDGKVAFITGGASGLGLATAECFSAAGYRVLIADLDRESGHAAAARLAGAGAEVEFVATDVASPQQVEAAVERALTLWGRLDFVFNNAGIRGRKAKIEDLDEGDLDRVLDVNLKGPFVVCRHAVRVQKQHGGGAILNVSSITGAAGSAYFPAYSASKAGVVALTRSIARNVGRFNIRVNCLSPGSITGTGLMEQERLDDPDRWHDGMTGLLRKIPLGRTGRPEDVANVALFLASPFARHIHGSVIVMDGGESLGYH